MSDLLTSIRRAPIFRRLSDQRLAEIAAEIATRQLSAGEVLFYEGDPASECFLIVYGALEVIAHSTGEEIRLEVRRDTQIIGEMAILDQAPRSAMVRAVEPTLVAIINEPAFMSLLGGDPELALQMLRDGTARIRNTNQRMIADLEVKNAEIMRAYEDLKAAQGELIKLNRIEEELAVARRIQESFLPRSLPQPAGWQLAAFSRGAQAVGGDFFDCIPLAGGRLGLVVADVCGKGVTAALFVALTRSLLRAATIAPWAFRGDVGDHESVLTGALWLTNDYITREHSNSDMFITLFDAVLDPQTGRLLFINAGHNPPLLVDGAGQARELEGGTLPIGIIPDLNLPIIEQMIAPGEKLVAFSDGITEAMNPAGEPFGDERLHELLSQHSHLSAQALVDLVIEAVDRYANGAPQADDMTLLIAHRDVL